MKLKEILNYGKDYLKKYKIEDYGIIAKELVEYVFKIKKEEIIIKNETELDSENTNMYFKLIEKVAEGTPIQYITNRQEFMKMNFYVDENVLIPQPDTENLVEEIINEYKDKNCKILDLCTGSGIIAISLAKYIKNSNIIASDISSKALQIAKLNAEQNLVKNQIEFVESDMFDKIKNQEFDVIVSNPPYIKTAVIESLEKQVKKEPHIALDGGYDGLKFYKIIFENSYKYLKKEGKVFVEIGYDQKEDLVNIINQNINYENIYCKKDLSGNDRIIVATVKK